MNGQGVLWKAILFIVNLQDLNIRMLAIPGHSQYRIIKRGLGADVA